MKKLSIILAAAMAALALASCNKNETDAPETAPKARITIGAKPSERVDVSKTYLSESATPTGSAYSVKWSNSGEQMGALFGDLSSSPTLITLSADDTENNDPLFYGEGSLDDGTYGLFLFYPRTAYEKCYADGTVGFNLKATQHPMLGTFDPTCDLMGWSTDNVTVENGSLTLEDITLVRPMAILRVNLNADEGSKGKGLVITSFKMEVPSDASSDEVILTGRAAISNLGVISKWNVKNNYVEASIDAAELITIGESDGFNALYMIINPTSIPAGRSINFSVETEEYNGVNKITRTVTAPEGGMAFEAGKVNTINLKIRDKDVPGTVVVEDYNGDWLITGVKDKVTYAAKAYDGSSNNLKMSEALTFSEDGSTITSETDLEECCMTLTKITEGDYEGLYTIQDANGKYLYAASNSGNQLKARNTPDVNSYWTVTMDGENYSIVASKSENRNVMQFNGSSSIFACYASASQSAVKLYPWSMVSVDTTPKITFPETSKEITSAATSVVFSYTKNKYVTTLPTYSIYAGSGCVDGEIVITDESVTIPISANPNTAPRFIYVDISGEGIAETVRLEIKQAAYEPATTTTISDILAGGAGTYSSVENLLVYAVSGSNAIVGDDTGKMLLYKSGMTVGNNISIANATVIDYNNTGVLEINGGTFTTNTSGNSVSHGTPVDLDDATAAAEVKTTFTATGYHPAQFVKITGTQSGRNISNANANLYLNVANATNDGKSVIATGYIYSWSTSHSNYNFQLVSIEEYIDPNTPSISATPTELTWEADEYGESAAKTITVTLNENATGFGFTVEEGYFNKFEVTKNDDNTVTVYPKAANTSTTETVYTLLSIDHKDDENVSALVALRQSHAGNGTTEVTDILNNAFTGVSGTNYTAWSGKVGTSGTIYAGQSAGSNNTIQLRSKNSNSGVVTTASVGKAKKITVTWNSSTLTGRTLNVYGKATAYSQATDLYSSNTRGTLIGTIVCGTSTTLTISDSYQYIGFRSDSDAMYLDKVEIVWEK